MKQLLFVLALAAGGMPALLRAQFEGLSDPERRRLLALPSATQQVDTLAEAIALFQKAITERAALGDFPGVAACYLYLGQIQKDNGRYDDAIDLYQQSLDIMRAQPPHHYTGLLHSQLGAAYKRRGRGKAALEHFRESMDIYSRLTPHSAAERRDIRSGQASVRLHLSILQQENLGLYKEAGVSLKKSLADFQALGDARNAAKCYLLLGNNAYYVGDLKAALEWYTRALASGGALDQEDRAIASKNRGRIYLDQRKYDEAKRDFQASLDGFVDTNNSREIAAARFEIGNFYFEQAQPAQAAEYYQQALASDLKDPMLKARILHFLTDALDQIGRREEAQQYAWQYEGALKSLDSLQMRGAFEELIRYKLEKKRGREREFEWEKRTMRTTALTGAAFLSLLALLAAMTARLHRQKRRAAERGQEIARKNEELARKNEQLALQENLDLLRRKEMEINYARLAGQDDMQRKIGRELHDGVGALLTTVKLNLAPVDEVLDRLPAEKRAQYAAANRLLDDACEELRRISHELGSALLQKFGLKAQLEALADIISRSGKFRVELATHGLRERLDYNLELNIYRIVQELFQNVVKHAQAQNITIQVNRFDDYINIMVEDDGKGFEVEKIAQSPGLGMQNLAARVHDLGGEMQLDSRPGRGTSICIDFPFSL